MTNWVLSGATKSYQPAASQHGMMDGMGWDGMDGGQKKEVGDSHKKARLHKAIPSSSKVNLFSAGTAHEHYLSHYLSHTITTALGNGRLHAGYAMPTFINVGITSYVLENVRSKLSQRPMYVELVFLSR
jgi:hypothetical protein